ncbi:MAG: DUF2974 domain-containing protein [Ruminococcaceae bacterium]|nr:DUF2974 domain-containing protein [Oscillospiraceae bacterium]
MAEKNNTTVVWDYLRWRGDLRLSQDGFNEVDNLLLCIVSYIDFRRVARLRNFDPSYAMSIGDVCDLLTEEDEQRGLSPEDYIPVMRAMAATPRFRDVKMFAFEDSYDEEKVMQFSAVSFLLPDESVFVAYRGTDTTLVGWVEDFNMSFMTAVPAQLRATEYAVEVAGRVPHRDLRIGGHSKGGNLAAWAAIHLPEKLQTKRLLAAYNNDGPGFDKSVLESDGFARVAEKLHTYIPESSAVGMLLEHTEDYTIIDSTTVSLLQHEPLSWNVLGNRFMYLGKRSEAAQLGDNVIREWLAGLTREERQEFVETLHQLLSAGGKIKTLEDLHSGGLSSGIALIKEYAGADEDKKKMLSDLVGRLAVDAKEELRRAAGEKLKSVGEDFRQVLDKLRIV